MPGYDTHIRTLRLGGLDYLIRSLADLQQCAAPDNSAPFTRTLAAQGFVVVERRCRVDESDTPPFRGRLLSYARVEAVAGTGAAP